MGRTGREREREKHNARLNLIRRPHNIFYKSDINSRISEEMTFTLERVVVQYWKSITIFLLAIDIHYQHRMPCVMTVISSYYRLRRFATKK